ncbi:hypothetical protein GQ43DRAFT_478306 [Delitschia confertaspora ATCC 74209]|uniref:Uncharacterized protein n=1 Tax=Delitschia confertaspora ATCC 74209 TaxID=1513339 RepID=A0A9P4JW44_9PLEO|nr:hypothetical protein GQ43DRAFT_478306 [Delitschia confertaspora ATCC 74209]
MARLTLLGYLRNPLPNFENDPGEYIEYSASGTPFERAEPPPELFVRPLTSWTSQADSLFFKTLTDLLSLYIIVRDFFIKPVLKALHMQYGRVGIRQHITEEKAKDLIFVKSSGWARKACVGVLMIRERGSIVPEQFQRARSANGTEDMDVWERIAEEKNGKEKELDEDDDGEDDDEEEAEEEEDEAHTPEDYPFGDVNSNDLEGNARVFYKQAYTYANERKCQYVAIFDWGHFVIFQFRDMAITWNGSTGAEANIIIVKGKANGRKAFLGFLIEACSKAPL